LVGHRRPDLCRELYLRAISPLMNRGAGTLLRAAG
jgi:hypothetical protein